MRSLDASCSSCPHHLSSRLSANRRVALEPDVVSHLGRCWQVVKVIRVDGAIDGFLERLVRSPQCAQLG